MNLFWTNDNGVVKLWYPDGDFCAQIEENLGLGISAQDVAKSICDAFQKDETPKNFGWWGRYFSFEDEVGELEIRMIWIGPMSDIEVLGYFDEFRHNFSDEPPTATIVYDPLLTPGYPDERDPDDPGAE